MRYWKRMEHETADTENKTLEQDITVLFEDDDVVVISKPAGLIVHSDGRTEEPSVADWMLEQYPQTSEVGEPWLSPQGETIARPGIVHRLDRTTSGVMVLAKRQEVFLALKKQFQDRTVQKIYDALVYGHPKEDSGIIEAEIGRTKKKPRKWIAYFAHGKKRAAITNWRVVNRYSDPVSGEPLSHMEVEPKTGRTHQIRVHLKAIHHPILCDHLYAASRPCILGFTRPALHARTLEIALLGGERCVFEAPLPNDFTQAFVALG